MYDIRIENGPPVDTAHQSTRPPEHCCTRCLRAPCGPCEPAAKYLKEVFDAAQPAHCDQVPTQEMHITYEGYLRRIGYNPDGSTGYSLPWLQLDGENGHHPNDMDGDMVYDFTDVYTTEWFDQYVSKPSGMELSVTHSVVGQAVTFDATLMPYALYEEMDPQPNLVLHAAIIEETTVNNVGSNGQTEFQYVMKNGAESGVCSPLTRLSLCLCPSRIRLTASTRDYQ